MKPEIRATRLADNRLAFLGPLVVALVTRLIGVGSRPLWYDEAFSVLFSDKGPAAMLAGTLTTTAAGAAEEHPLAYYSMLWMWMRAFGESLVAVRALSILAGLGVVLAAYLLAREVFDPKVALAAGFIVALSPFQIHYSQEVRMYVVLCVWLLLATYAYRRPVQTSAKLWWGAFALFAALAQYTHNLAAFYLLALALWPILMRDWRAVKGVAIAGLIAVLLYAPWLIHLPAQFAKVGQTFWIEKPGLYRVLTLLLVYVPNLPLPGLWLGVGLFIALAVVAIAAIQTVQAQLHHEPHAQGGIWMLYLAFVPPALLFLFSQWKPLYLERALLPSGAVFCVWVAWALLKPGLARPVRILFSGLLVAGFGMGIYEHATYSGFPYAPYSALTGMLRAEERPGDAIVHSSKLTLLPSVYYDRELPQVFIADPPGSTVDTLAASTQQVLGVQSRPDIATAAGNARRVWFIIFDESNQEYVRAGYPEHPQLAWLMQHYTEADLKSWGDLRVYLFLRSN